MSELFLYVRDISDSIAVNYNLDVNIFFIIYFSSFVPFYLGYLLMVYGTTRKISWKDILGLNIKTKLVWNTHVTVGLFVHLFGRIMPYVYIAIWGKNLPWWIYVFVWGTIIISLGIFVHKVLPKRKYIFPKDIEIKTINIVDNIGEAESLWNIYNETFIPLNKISPCKQSLDYHHFIESLHDQTVKKYIISKAGVGLMGLALVTNDFKNTPWISDEYFRAKFPSEFKDGSIYYFMGLAVKKEFRGNQYSLFLLEYIIDDLPRNVVFGFDHSRNINPMLHHFTKIIKHSNFINRTHIDRQHYHVVQWKK